MNKEVKNHIWLGAAIGLFISCIICSFNYATPSYPQRSIAQSKAQFEAFKTTPIKPAQSTPKPALMHMEFKRDMNTALPSDVIITSKWPAKVTKSNGAWVVTFSEPKKEKKGKK